ncbi:MAG: YhdP family protein, partial [Wenzhouxiangella sp.]
MRRETDQPSWLAAFFGRLRGIIATALALVIILAAVIVGVGRLLIPYADQARPWLEGYLSDQIGQEVAIGRIEAVWPRLTPQVTLEAVRVGAVDDPLARMDQARVEVHLRHLFRPERNVVNLIVLGLDLVLAEDEAGHWGVQLEGGGRLWSGQGDEPLAGDLILRDASVEIRPRQLPVTAWHLEEAEVRRSGDRSIVLGRLRSVDLPGAGMDIRMRADHPGGRIAHVDGWAGIRDLRLDADLIGNLFGKRPDDFAAQFDAGVWMSWSAGDIARFDSEFSLDAGRGRTWSGQASFERDGAGRIDAEFRKMRVGDRVLAGDVLLAHAEGRWGLSVENFDLSVAHGLAAPWFGDRDWWPESAGGRVEALEVLFERGVGLHAAGGRISDLNVSPVRRAPGLSGLDLDISLDGDRLALTPSGRPEIEWPNMLRREVVLDRVGGRVLVSPEGVTLEGVAIEHPVTSATADGWIYFGQSRPFLDFGVRVDRVATENPSDWLPRRIIPERALAWLDRSLGGVEQGRGQLLFHMRAGRKAKEFQPGDFQASLDFSGARLDYWPDWPAATALAGEVDFVGRTLTGRVERGRLGRLELAADQVVIPDLTQPELSMLVATDRGEADTLAALLTDMPLPAIAAISEPTQWSGPVSLAVELVLPFRHMEDWQLDGELALDGVDFALPELGLGLSSLRGTAFFDRDQVLPCVLHAMSGPRMVTMDLAARFGDSPNLQLGGQFHPADIILSGGPLSTISDRLIGSTYWQLDLHPAGDGALGMTLASDLEGIGIELPQPLAKLPAESWPMRAAMTVGEEALEMRLSLAERVTADLRRADGAWFSGVALGGAVARMPDTPGFDIRGRIESLDAKAWLELLASSAAPMAGGAGQGRVQLAIDRLNFGNLHLEDLNLELDRGDNDWIAELDGAAAGGRINIPVPLDSGRVLAVDLDRLVVGHEGIETESFELESAPGAGQTSTVNP